MTSDHTGRYRSTARDILATIAEFQAGNLRLSTFLDRSWAQIQDLAPRGDADIATLEDYWTEIEIIYAQASAAQQSALDEAQTRDLARAVDDLAAALRRGR